MDISVESKGPDQRSMRSMKLLPLRLAPPPRPSTERSPQGSPLGRSLESPSRSRTTSSLESVARLVHRGSSRTIDRPLTQPSSTDSSRRMRSFWARPISMNSQWDRPAKSARGVQFEILGMNHEYLAEVPAEARALLQPISAPARSDRIQAAQSASPPHSVASLDLSQLSAESLAMVSSHSEAASTRLVQSHTAFETPHSSTSAWRAMMRATQPVHRGQLKMS